MRQAAPTSIIVAPVIIDDFDVGDRAVLVDEHVENDVSLLFRLLRDRVVTRRGSRDRHRFGVDRLESDGRTEQLDLTGQLHGGALDEIPESAKVIFYPLPFLPNKGVAERLAEFVKGIQPGGGTVLGDALRDAMRVAPEDLVAIQRAYVEAGSDLLLTNTFGASRIMLERHDQGERTAAINRAGVEVDDAHVAGREGTERYRRQLRAIAARLLETVELFDRGGIDEAIDTAQERTFTRSAQTDDGHKLPFGHIEGHVAQRDRAIIIDLV